MCINNWPSIFSNMYPLYFSIFRSRLITMPDYQYQSNIVVLFIVIEKHFICVLQILILDHASVFNHEYLIFHIYIQQLYLLNNYSINIHIGIFNIKLVKWYHHMLPPASSRLLYFFPNLRAAVQCHTSQIVPRVNIQ